MVGEVKKEQEHHYLEGLRRSKYLTAKYFSGHLKLSPPPHRFFFVNPLKRCNKIKITTWNIIFGGMIIS